MFYYKTEILLKQIKNIWFYSTSVKLEEADEVDACNLWSRNDVLSNEFNISYSAQCTTEFLSLFLIL